MYQTLYRKYRPTTFDEVVGQSVIVRTLKNAIKNNVLNHAYLFTGPRGTGKTSVAKILAKTINCKNPHILVPCNKCVCCTQNNISQAIDIVEIDAASNNGVDEIRELKSKVNLVPSVGKYKIYIIDEVHMLTTGAFNALLKTLEEPPSHIIFILATTEPHKIPLTILSRCQRFDFKKITENDIYGRLNDIVKQESIRIDEDALRVISRAADGGLRDALSLLDQVIAYAEDQIHVEDVHEINGTVTQDELENLFTKIDKSQIDKVISIIEKFDQQGKNFIKLAEETILFLRDYLLKNRIYNKKQSEYNTSISNILKKIKIMNVCIHDMKISGHPKIIFEIGIIDMINLSVHNIDFNIEKQETNIIQEPVIETLKEPETNFEPLISKNIVEENSHNKFLASLDLLKNIRTNNTLCNFNKKELIDWKMKINKISDVLLDPIYGESASILLDGSLKAVGGDNMIFVYDSEHLANLFNEKLKNIDLLFEYVYKIKIKTIATSKLEWEVIKKEFNSKIKQYQYIEEDDKLVDHLNVQISNGDIESIFGNIVEYK